MKRSASEIIRNLESRIARLERTASKTKKAYGHDLPKYVLEDAIDSIEQQFDISGLNSRDFEVQEKGVSKKYGYNYFLVSIVDDNITGEEFYALISEDDGDHQLDDVYDDDDEAYYTWKKLTK